MACFEVCCFYFFPNSALRNRGCGLSMDAAYTRTFTVSGDNMNTSESGCDGILTK